MMVFEMSASNLLHEIKCIFLGEYIVSHVSYLTMMFSWFCHIFYKGSEGLTKMVALFLIAHGVN